eukprot:Amastigsp_a1978_14.p2 type:complete len:303 gc:universal Amastigsp_a1978_14:554-1462(+)
MENRAHRHENKRERDPRSARVLAGLFVHAVERGCETRERVEHIEPHLREHPVRNVDGAEEHPQLHVRLRANQMVRLGDVKKRAHEEAEPDDGPHHQVKHVLARECVCPQCDDRPQRSQRSKRDAERKHHKAIQERVEAKEHACPSELLHLKRNREILDNVVRVRQRVLGRLETFLELGPGKRGPDRCLEPLSKSTWREPAWDPLGAHRIVGCVVARLRPPCVEAKIVERLGRRAHGLCSGCALASSRCRCCVFLIDRSQLYGIVPISGGQRRACARTAVNARHGALLSKVNSLVETSAADVS